MDDARALRGLPAAAERPGARLLRAAREVAREAGALRPEGKEYEMQDGDVVEFMFN